MDGLILAAKLLGLAVLIATAAFLVGLVVVCCIEEPVDDPDELLP